LWKKIEGGNGSNKKKRHERLEWSLHERSSGWLESEEGKKVA